MDGSEPTERVSPVAACTDFWLLTWSQGTPCSAIRGPMPGMRGSAGDQGLHIEGIMIMKLPGLGLPSDRASMDIIPRILISE